MKYRDALAAYLEKFGRPPPMTDFVSDEKRAAAYAAAVAKGEPLPEDYFDGDRDPETRIY